MVMSHAHIDHCGGIMADDGIAAISRMRSTTSRRPTTTSGPTRTRCRRSSKIFLDTARKNLTPNRDRMHFFKDGEEFLPGVHAILAPGHTVGHTIFMITVRRQAALPTSAISPTIRCCCWRSR